MKRRTLRTLRYIAILFGAFVCGLVIALQAEVETDAQLQQIDTFITMHKSEPVETEPETVSLSYTEWKEENIAINNQPTDSTTDSTAVYSDLYDPEPLQAEVAVMSVEDFQCAGVIDWNGWRYTYYSEQVLPGGGLDIPGRWSDGQFVRDCDGYLCVACNDIPQGSVVDTPFGQAIVYDLVGEGGDGVIDIYCSW